MKYLLRFVICMFLVIIAVNAAMSHPVSLTYTKVVVSTNCVDVQIKVLYEDFMMFYELSPDYNDEIAGSDLEESAERHRDLLLREFFVRNESGERLAGTIIKLESDSDYEHGVSLDNLMDFGVVYHISYPLTNAPSHITFQQNLGKGIMAFPAMMELDVQQNGLQVSDIVTLSNSRKIEAFAFNWDGNGLPGKTAEDAWRLFREKRKKERMGIESYDEIYGFVYMRKHDVLIEVLVPLLTLETWIDVPRVQADFLEVAEQLAARETLEKFFCEKNSVRIDGVKVTPTLQRLDFYGLNFSDFAQRAEPRRLSALTARVGATLSYSTKGYSREVEVQWEYFNRNIYTANTTIYAGGETVKEYLTPKDAIFRWKSPGEPLLPPMVNVCIKKGAKYPNESDAKSVAGALLRNVYRAFDYNGESEIYDALERSVHGDLLADLYLKINDGLRMQEQGGAVARVQAVNIDSSSLLAGDSTPDTFAVDMSWTVEGTVEHWGHIHTRINHYRATFGICVVDKAWKIERMNVLEQKRISYKVKVRK